MKQFSFIIEFNDLHLTNNFKAAKKALKGMSGIYCIVCTVTGAMYIGSSVDMANRLVDHLIDNSTNVYLQNALAKYGIENFVFKVVECCSQDQLLSREQHYLDILFTLPKSLRYNISKVAESSFSGLHHLPETRERISTTLKGKHSGSNNSMFGRTGENHPMFGKPGPNSGVTPVNAIKVFVYLASNNTLVSEFSSQVEAAKFLNVNQSTVYRYLLSGKVFQNKYILCKSLLP